MNVTCETCGITVDVEVVKIGAGKNRITVSADGLVAVSRHCREVQARGGVRTGSAEEYKCDALATSVGKIVDP